MSGINYIIREPHYDENCYKIGTSSSETIKRICDYKKGTQIICILKSNNSLETEKIIKRKFNSSFVLTSGSEYFSGDEYEMMKLFIEIIMDYNKDHISLIDNTKNTDLLIINNEKEIEKKIKKLFKKYKFEDFEVLDKINKYVRIIYTSPCKIYIYLSLDDNDILINNTINTNRRMWGLPEIKL
jgi:hypothetical protein